jgi:hypothetical protein
MIEDGPTPWLDEAVCVECSGSLLPLTYSPASADDTSLGVEPRAHVKCAGCGRRYRWVDSAGWTPLDSVGG